MHPSELEPTSENHEVSAASQSTVLPRNEFGSASGTALSQASRVCLGARQHRGEVLSPTSIQPNVSFWFSQFEFEFACALQRTQPSEWMDTRSLFSPARPCSFAMLARRFQARAAQINVKIKKFVFIFCAHMGCDGAMRELLPVPAGVSRAAQTRAVSQLKQRLLRASCSTRLRYRFFLLGYRGVRLDLNSGLYLPRQKDVELGS